MRPEDVVRYRSGRLENVAGRLYTLALGQLPKAACAAVERLAGITAIYAIGFAWDDLHYGRSHLGLDPRRRARPGAEEIETLVHQATIAMRRFRAEAELRESAEQFNVFFSESLDLLGIADTDGYFRRVNPQWEATLGFPDRGTGEAAIP